MGIKLSSGVYLSGEAAFSEQFSLFDLLGNVDFPQQFNLELNFQVFWPWVRCTATDNGNLGAETTGNALVLGTDMFCGTNATALGRRVVYRRSRCLEKQKVDNLKPPVAVNTDIPLHFIHLPAQC